MSYIQFLHWTAGNAASQRDTYSGFDVREDGGSGGAPKAEGSSVENIGTKEHLEGVIADMSAEKLAGIVAQLQGEKGARLGREQLRGAACPRRH